MKDASQKVALLVEKQGIIFLTNLSAYIIFSLPAVQNTKQQILGITGVQ